MTWIHSLLDGDTVTGSLLILALVAVLGLLLGAVRVRGIKLGVAGVLFSGLLMGHVGWKLSHDVLHFVRELGLVLFVYSIGMQVGVGFFDSMRRQGLKLNLLAAAVVALGTLMTLGAILILHVPVPAAVGVLAGATTNTPSLASAQDAITQLADHSKDMSKMPGLGYAVAYPLGIVGIILAMLLLKWALKIVIRNETLQLSHAADHEPHGLVRMNLTVTNANLAGVMIKDVPVLTEQSVVISRWLSGGQICVPNPEDRLNLGDVVLAVGPPDVLEKLRIVMGHVSDQNLMTHPSQLTHSTLLVTKKSVIGLSPRELNLEHTYGAKITRIIRNDVELPANDSLHLNYGDKVNVVGTSDGIKHVAGIVGNSEVQLQHAELVPVFVGVALGVIVGSIPFSIPGVPAPVKLGLAGGPLIIALLLARIRRVGPLIWYIPHSANLFVRELGIVLFMACVGLKSGDQFWPTLTQGHGLMWMGLGFAITLVPLLIVGTFARLVMKMNYLPICGVLAGSMTDPPALAFASSTTGSEAPNIAYAAVYPLTMTLRIIAAQVLVLSLM